MDNVNCGKQDAGWSIGCGMYVGLQLKDDDGGCRMEMEDAGWRMEVVGWMIEKAGCRILDGCFKMLYGGLRMDGSDGGCRIRA